MNDAPNSSIMQTVHFAAVIGAASKYRGCRDLSVEGSSAGAECLLRLIGYFCCGTGTAAPSCRSC